MKNDYKDVHELLTCLIDEKTSYEFLKKQIWGNNEGICPFCPSKKISIINGGRKNLIRTDVEEYQCERCKKKFAITTGTIFHNSKIELRTWFATIYLITSSKRELKNAELKKLLAEAIPQFKKAPNSIDNMRERIDTTITKVEHSFISKIGQPLKRIEKNKWFKRMVKDAHVRFTKILKKEKIDRETYTFPDMLKIIERDRKLYFDEMKNNEK